MFTDQAGIARTKREAPVRCSMSHTKDELAASSYEPLNGIDFGTLCVLIWHL